MLIRHREEVEVIDLQCERWGEVGCRGRSTRRVQAVDAIEVAPPPSLFVQGEQVWVIEEASRGDMIRHGLRILQRLFHLLQQVLL